MIFPRSGLIAVSLAALLAAGCSSSRFSSEDTTPEPLTPAPSGTVIGDQLPPPPAAPGRNSPPPQAPRPMSRRFLRQYRPRRHPTAPDVTASSVAGVWNATVSGQSCKVATPQTKFGAGFRAGPLRCPAPLDGVKSWNVAGKQLALYDADGGVLARLYSSSAERFDGQTESGVPISLNR